MERGIFIQDPEVVNKMAQIEGAEWAKDQEKDNGYTVASFLKEFNAVKAATSDNDLGVLRIDGNTAIYGFGGWNRYFVLATTGEIFLSRSHARDEKIEKAREIGMDIWG